jgi:hypothetical protein
MMSREWKNGMMEYWNNGMAASWEGRRIAVLAVDPTALPKPIFPNTPPFRYSNIPMK